MRVHSERFALWGPGSAQLHIHHVHVLEARASRLVSLAGLAPAQTLLSSAHLKSATSTHNHGRSPGWAARAAAAMVLEFRGRGDRKSPANRAFIEHSEAPCFLVARGPSSRKPSSVWPW